MAKEIDWKFFDYDPVLMKTTYFRVLDDKQGTIQMRETIPMWLANAIIEDNKEREKDFTDKGGWSGHKKGAVVCAVPHHLDKHFKEMAGQDVAKGGEYDHNRYNSFLDDIDYKHLRTGGGKIGRKTKQAVGIKSRLLVGSSPLTLAKAP